MKKKSDWTARQVSDAWLVGGGFLLGLVLACAFTHMPGSSSDWAAWFQAFGATIGIAIAIWVPMNQRRYESHREAETALLEKARVVTNAHEIVKDAVLALQGAHTYVSNLDPVEEFTHTTDRLLAAQTLVESAINTAVMPYILRRLIRVNRQLTLSIRDVRAWHDAQATSSLTALKNNMKTRLERATASRDEIGKAGKRAQDAWRELRDFNQSRWIKVKP